MTRWSISTHLPAFTRPKYGLGQTRILKKLYESPDKLVSLLQLAPMRLSSRDDVEISEKLSTKLLSGVIPEIVELENM